MLPKTKFNALCREIAEETDEAWLDRFYDDYLAAKFAEATIMEYAARVIAMLDARDANLAAIQASNILPR